MWRNLNVNLKYASITHVLLALIFFYYGNYFRFHYQSARYYPSRYTRGSGRKSRRYSSLIHYTLPQTLPSTPIQVGLRGKWKITRVVVSRCAGTCGWKGRPPRPFSISNFEPDIGRRGCDGFSRRRVFAGIFFQVNIPGEGRTDETKGEKCATNDSTNPTGPQWL